jgi:hypothetical protein
VGKIFYSEFKVGLNVHYVCGNAIRDIRKNPPIRNKDKNQLRCMYKKTDKQGKIIYDVIVHNLSLSEKEKPHFILYMIGDRKVIPKDIDFFTWPVYLGNGKYAGVSRENICGVKINTILGLSNCIQHELSHSLGAIHTDEDSLMRPYMVHGRTVEAWDNTNKTIIKKRLNQLNLYSK